MTFKEILEISDEEENIQEGFKEKLGGAFIGASLLLSLATAAGIPQKLLLKYDVNNLIKEMPASAQKEYKRLYSLDEKNGTNRSGVYMVNFIEDTVENGGGSDMMKKVYNSMHPENKVEVEKKRKKFFNY